MNKNYVLIICLSVLVCISTNRIFAQPGTLDKTFDTDGKVTTTINPIYDCNGGAVAMQPDGKMVVAGSSYTGANYDDFVVVRYNSDGSLDNAFSTDGKTTTNFKNRDDRATAVAIQADGKIVVGGIVDSAYMTNFGIARYNSDGSLDPTFSGDGKVLIRMNANNDYENLYDLIVLPNGKIIAVGMANRRFTVMCLNANGYLDMTFNGKGWLAIAFTGTFDEATAVAVQQNGKIVIAGSAYMTNATDKDFAVVRINPDGTQDNTFSTDGKMNVTINSTYNYAKSVVIQTDGKIVVGGGVKVGSDYDCALIRLNSDGTLDNSFSGDGKLSHSILTYSDEINDMILQKDGKILAVAAASNGSTSYFALLRYNQDGTLDSIFGTKGITTTLVGNVSNGAGGIALQKDGKIIAAGSAKSASSPYTIAVARYISGAAGSISQTLISDMKVYPNPSIDFLHLEYQLKNATTVSIYLLDMMGRVVLSTAENKQMEAGQQTETIDLQSLSKGIYTLIVRTQNSEQSYLIVH